MRRVCRVMLSVGFLAMAGYLFLWSVQSTSFSVAEEGVAKAVLEMKAVLLLPISLLSAAVGIIFFLVLAPARAAREATGR